MKKTILITGASTGIGKATAQYFQSKGWNVSATMRNPDKASELKELNNVICTRLDVLDDKSINNAINETLEHFGQINAIVNNAGYAALGPFEAATEAQIKKQFETNVYGLMKVTQAILPYFRQQQQGTIIQVSSMGGRLTLPLYSLYHGSKWAVEGFSESLQYELRQFGIKVKIVEPGPIKTDFYGRSQDLIKNDELTTYDNYVNKVLNNIEKAGKSAQRPEVVARTIYKAANDRSAKIRYGSGKEAHGYLFLRKHLPVNMFNGIVRRVLEK